MGTFTISFRARSKHIQDPVILIGTPLYDFAKPKVKVCEVLAELKLSFAD